MEYTVIQYADNLEVFFRENLFLKVIRNHNWWGTLISKFYKEDMLIMESHYRISFYKTYISLKYQLLDKKITVSKIKGDHLLMVDSHVFQVKKRSFKNPVYTVFKDGSVYANVHTKGDGLVLPPYEYKVIFETEDEYNFYGLIWILMHFRTLYI
jgi:hypothetical protein